MGLSRQESWSVLPCLSPGDLPNPGIEPRSPTMQADYRLSHQGSPSLMIALLLKCVHSGLCPGILEYRNGCRGRKFRFWGKIFRVKFFKIRLVVWFGQIMVIFFPLSLSGLCVSLSAAGMWFKRVAYLPSPSPPGHFSRTRRQNGGGGQSPWITPGREQNSQPSETVFFRSG